MAVSSPVVLEIGGRSDSAELLPLYYRNRKLCCRQFTLTAFVRASESDDYYWLLSVAHAIYPIFYVYKTYPAEIEVRAMHVDTSDWLPLLTLRLSEPGCTDTVVQNALLDVTRARVSAHLVRSIPALRTHVRTTSVAQSEAVAASIFRYLEEAYTVLLPANLLPILPRPPGQHHVCTRGHRCTVERMRLVSYPMHIDSDDDHVGRQYHPCDNTEYTYKFKYGDVLQSLKKGTKMFEYYEGVTWSTVAGGNSGAAVYAVDNNSTEVVLGALISEIDGGVADEVINSPWINSSQKPLSPPPGKSYADLKMVRVLPWKYLMP